MGSRIAPGAAPALERLAREEAWAEFLAQVAFSLTVWQIDADIRRELESPLAWLARCSRELQDIGERS